MRVITSRFENLDVVGAVVRVQGRQKHPKFARGDVR